MPPAPPDRDQGHLVLTPDVNEIGAIRESENRESREASVPGRVNSHSHPRGDTAFEYRVHGQFATTAPPSVPPLCQKTSCLQGRSRSVPPTPEISHQARAPASR